MFGNKVYLQINKLFIFCFTGNEKRVFSKKAACQNRGMREDITLRYSAESLHFTNQT